MSEPQDETNKPADDTQNEGTVNTPPAENDETQAGDGDGTDTPPAPADADQ